MIEGEDVQLRTLDIMTWSKPLLRHRLQQAEEELARVRKEKGDSEARRSRKQKATRERRQVVPRASPSEHSRAGVWMPVKEAAATLRCGASTINARVRAGELTAKMASGRRYVLVGTIAGPSDAAVGRGLNAFLDVTARRQSACKGRRRLMPQRNAPLGDGRMTTAQAAIMLNTSKTEVARLARDGGLVAEKVAGIYGPRWAFDTASVESARDAMLLEPVPYIATDPPKRREEWSLPNGRVTMDWAARELDVSTTFVRKAIRNGDIVGEHVEWSNGTRWSIDRESVQALKLRWADRGAEVATSPELPEVKGSVSMREALTNGDAAQVVCWIRCYCSGMWEKLDKLETELRSLQRDLGVECDTRESRPASSCLLEDGTAPTAEPFDKVLAVAQDVTSESVFAEESVDDEF